VLIGAHSVILPVSPSAMLAASAPWAVGDEIDRAGEMARATAAVAVVANESATPENHAMAKEFLARAKKK